MADSNQEKFRDALAELQNVEEAEKEIVGVDTSEVSATIFAQWKFESKLVNVIKYCTNPNAADEDDQRAAAILNVVRVAVPLNGVITDASIAAAKELIEKYNLDMESFDKAIENAQ